MSSVQLCLTFQGTGFKASAIGSKVALHTNTTRWKPGTTFASLSSVPFPPNLKNTHTHTLNFHSVLYRFCFNRCVC